MSYCDRFRYGTDGYPMVTTRGQFGPMGTLDRDRSKTEYERRNPDHFPGADGGGPPSELTVFVHGLGQSPLSAMEKTCSTAAAMDQAGYEHPVVGFSWDSDYVGWYRARNVAWANGPKLAQFLADCGDRGTDTLRVVAHSLGARVTFAALDHLARKGRDDLDSVALVGGAVRATDVAEHGPLGGIVDDYATGGFAMDNYWSREDGTLKNWFKPAEFWAEAVGRTGCQGAPPTGFRDVDVTGEVDDHNGYIRPEDGCMGRVVGNFES